MSSTRHLEERIMVHGRPAGVVRLSVNQRVTMDTPHLLDILEAFARALGSTAEANQAGNDAETDSTQAKG